jgi:hypothetical protein
MSPLIVTREKITPLGYSRRMKYTMSTKELAYLNKRDKYKSSLPSGLILGKKEIYEEKGRF